jgi:hypothetical protein
MTWNMSNASHLFKTKYGPLSENVYNAKNPVLMRYKKTYDFVGDQELRSIPQSFSGGVGSGTLPTATWDKGGKALITSKKLYAVAKIDREAIKAADGNEGSFVKQTKHTVQKTVESWMRNTSRQLWNQFDNGELGRGDGSTTVTGDGSSGTPYLVVINADYWKEANWEEQDLVNVATETTALRVVGVTASTREIQLVGTSATLAAAAGGATSTSAKIYMQGSKDNDLLSIPYILSRTTGTLFNLPVARRWSAGQYAASGGIGLTVDLMNEDMLAIDRRIGKTPDMIVTSYTQYRKLLNQLEDKKTYELQPRAENLRGHFSFKAMAYESAVGLIPIIFDRFVQDDAIAYLNSDFMELMHRPDFGWFDDDGTVFLRSNDDDAYEARYGGYLENYMPPNFHGWRTGLAV